MIMCNPAAKTAATYLFLNSHLQINSSLPALGWSFVFIHFKGPHVPAILRSAFLSRGLKWSQPQTMKDPRQKEKEWPRSQENSRVKPCVCSVQLNLTMLNLELNSCREQRNKMVSFHGDVWHFIMKFGNASKKVWKIDFFHQSRINISGLTFHWYCTRPEWHDLGWIDLGFFCLLIIQVFFLFFSGVTSFNWFKWFAFE